MAAVSGVMAAVRGEIRQSTTWSIVLSVLMMASGLLAIAIPSIAGLTVTVMFGWLLIVTSVLHLAFAWRGQGAATIVGEILVAVLYAAIGFYLLARPVAGLASLTLAVAWYLLAKGVLEGVIAFKLRPLPGSGWLVFDGILTIVIAAMIGAAWPASTAWAVGVAVGVAMVSSGFARLMVSTAERRLVA
jgi:uncharacterized membrane protein HdeD (DUF308 family)